MTIILFFSKHRQSLVSYPLKQSSELRQSCRPESRGSYLLVTWIQEFSTWLCRCSCCFGALSAAQENVVFMRAVRVSLLRSGCTENSSKIGRLPCLQRMPSLSRVTMQKGAKDGRECHPQCSLEKQTSASFTFAERAPPLHNVPCCRPGRKEHCRGSGAALVFVLFTHTLLPFQEQKFIFWTKALWVLRTCASFSPWHKISETKDLSSHHWLVSSKGKCLSKPGHL